MQKFYFGDSDSDSSDTDLPYPQPLTRASFLAPDFTPTSFLSSLHDRHQTLEDLRAELCARSQTLHKELLDLVNENYADFLSLGASLRGGDEKVEEVRVGLWGFKRDVEGLRGRVEARREEVEGLLKERKRIRGEVLLGRGLLEVEERVRNLEERLAVGDERGEGGNVSDSEEESEGEENEGVVSPSRLRKHAQRYLLIRRLVERIGPEHPFLVKLEERILRLRQTVLLDLSNALKGMQAFSDEEKGRVMKILGIYRDMGESDEALKVLRAWKRQSSVIAI